MTKAILIDDELNCINSLEYEILNHLPEISIIDKCTSPIKGYESILKNKPDLVFLDIDMTEMSGFELLEKFEKIDFNVIFCSGHSEYAINAFRISEVVDYLSKPAQPEQLREAYKRVKSRNNPGITTQHFNVLLENLKGPSPTKLTLTAESGMEIFELENIIYFQSEGQYIRVHVSNKKKPSIFTTTSITKLEKKLPTTKFCRVDQSSIINIDHLTNYNRGKQLAIMSNNDKVKISRSGKVSLDIALGNQNFL